MIRHVYSHTRLEQGSYYRRSSVYTHRRHSMARPAKLPGLRNKQVHPSEPLKSSKLPVVVTTVVVEELADIVLPAKRPTPSIGVHNKRLPAERHHTAL